MKTPITFDGAYLQDADGNLPRISEVLQRCNAHDQLVQVAKDHLAQLLNQRKKGAYGIKIASEIEATHAALIAAGVQP